MQGVGILEAGSLSNDNDDRSENKMCPLKFNCVYLNPFDLSNEGGCFLELNTEGLYPGSKQEKEKCLSYVHFLYKMSHQEVSGCSHGVDVKEMYSTA